MFLFVHTSDQIKDMKTVSDFDLYTLRGAESKGQGSNLQRSRNYAYACHEDITDDETQHQNFLKSTLKGGN
jgi:hypothetical protein